MTPLVVQAAAALAVAGALVYARRALRSRATRGGAPALDIRERLALGRDTGVAVVTWHGRELLVGYAASGVTVLWAGEEVEVDAA